MQLGLMDSLIGLGSSRPFLGDNEGTGVNCPYPDERESTHRDVPRPSSGTAGSPSPPGDLTPPSPAGHCYISVNDCTLPYVFDPFVWGSDPAPETHPFTLDAAADWAQAMVTQSFNPRSPRVIDDGVGGTQLNQANYSFFQWLWGACSACYGGGNTFSGTTNATVTLLFYGTRIDVYARKTAGSGIAAFSVDNGGETTVDLYAPRDVDNVVTYSSTVPLGLHTVKVRCHGDEEPLVLGQLRRGRQVRRSASEERRGTGASADDYGVGARPRRACRRRPSHPPDDATIVQRGGRPDALRSSRGVAASPSDRHGRRRGDAADARGRRRGELAARGAGPECLGAHAAKGLGSLPASARSAVSATLGAASREYVARRSATGYRLRAAASQRSSTADGVSLQAGRVSLVDDGCGARSRRPARAGRRAVGRRRGEPRLARPRRADGVVHGGAVRDRAGVHALPPPGRHGRPGHARAATRRRRACAVCDSGTVLLTRAGRPGLSYGQLSASDAKGRPLRAELQLRSGRLLIHVWDRGASYPLTIDPLIQQGDKLTGSGESGAGKFGYSVALSADGNTALIGGPDDNGNVGAAWVFTRSGSTWTQQGGS